MSRVDLYPNPTFVQAVRKDGYKEFSSDVFDTEDKVSKYYFIRNAIEITDLSLSRLRELKEMDFDYLHYHNYSNTINYLINYYEFLLEENMPANIHEISASYGEGIVTDYIKAVNSNKSILYTHDDEIKFAPPKKWPEKMNSWFPEKELTYNSTNYAPLLQIGGLKQKYGSYYYNLILVSSERNKGFEYNTKKIFMNWNGNPLNNKTD
jgi:hypothetical protein